MAIGDDVKETYEEVGIPYQVEKLDTGGLFDEKCLIEKYTEQSTEFIRQRVVVVNIPYDTEAVPGDLIHLEGEEFLITSKDSTRVENAVAFYRCMLYRCNDFCSIYTYNPNRGYDSNYNKYPEFSLEEENVPLLFLDVPRATEAEEIESVYLGSISGYSAYMQKRNIKEGDRIKLDDTFYLVENIHSHRLKGNFILYLQKVQDDTATY